MNKTRIAVALVVVATVWGCKIDLRDRGGTESLVGNPDVTGTYVAADSGTTLGKHWCYSSALVLDSTGHFGSVITMCGDDGEGPTTENLKGTYSFRKVTTRASRSEPAVQHLDVVLKDEGRRHKTHTLRYDAGTLRFDEPWWMGAGLRALDIADPTLRKVPASQLAADTTGSASSTPVAVTGASTKSAKKSAAK